MDHPHDPAPVPAPVPTPGPRVLLVEDNEAASKGLCKLLQAYGFRVTTAHDGASALEALAAAPPPDFLLTDLQLPDIDGRDIARQARTLDPPPRTALITGWDLEHAAGEPATWGIDWLVTKPVNIHDLLELLRGPAPPRLND